MLPWVFVIHEKSSRPCIYSYSSFLFNIGKFGQGCCPACSQTFSDICVRKSAFVNELQLQYTDVYHVERELTHGGNIVSETPDTIKLVSRSNQPWDQSDFLQNALVQASTPALPWPQESLISDSPDNPWLIAVRDKAVEADAWGSASLQEEKFEPVPGGPEWMVRKVEPVPQRWSQSASSTDVVHVPDTIQASVAPSPTPSSLPVEVHPDVAGNMETRDNESWLRRQEAVAERSRRLIALETRRS